MKIPFREHIFYSKLVYWSILILCWNLMNGLFHFTIGKNDNMVLALGTYWSNQYGPKAGKFEDPWPRTFLDVCGGKYKVSGEVLMKKWIWFPVFQAVRIIVNLNLTFSDSLMTTTFVKISTSNLFVNTILSLTIYRKSIQNETLKVS